MSHQTVSPAQGPSCWNMLMTQLNKIELMRTFWSPNVGGHQQPLKRVTLLTIPERSRSQNCQEFTWFSSVYCFIIFPTNSSSVFDSAWSNERPKWPGEEGNIMLRWWWQFCKRISVKKKLQVVATQRFFYVHPENLGKWSNLTCAYFSNGLVQPPTRKSMNMITGRRKFVMRKFVLLGCSVGFVRING